jgi:hypothetical protein
MQSQDDTIVVFGKGTVPRKAADDQLQPSNHLSTQQAQLNTGHHQGNIIHYKKIGRQLGYRYQNKMTRIYMCDDI